MRLTLDEILNFKPDSNEELQDKDLIKHDVILNVRKTLANWDERIATGEDKKKLSKLFYNCIIDVKSEILNIQRELNLLSIGEEHPVDIELSNVEKVVAYTKQNLWSLMICLRATIYVLVHALHDKLEIELKPKRRIVRRRVKKARNIKVNAAQDVKINTELSEEKVPF